MLCLNRQPVSAGGLRRKSVIFSRRRGPRSFDSYNKKNKELLKKRKEKDAYKPPEDDQGEEEE